MADFMVSVSSEFVGGRSISYAAVLSICRERSRGNNRSVTNIDCIGACSSHFERRREAK